MRKKGSRRGGGLLKGTRSLGLAIVAATAATAGRAAAQERPRGPDPEHRLERLTEVLELTEDQATAVGEILAEQDETRMELWARERDHREQMRDQMRALLDNTEGRLAEVLSEQQMETYRAHVREMRHHMRRRGGPGRPEQPGKARQPQPSGEPPAPPPPQ